MFDSAAWRMLDAAADRASEGLRVAGEVVRFFLEDAESTARLRNVRGEMWRIVSALPQARERLLSARDSATDAGRSLPSDARPRDAEMLLFSNLHRAEESLRCIEEVLRMLDPEAASRVGQLRYAVYECEKDLLPRMLHWSKRAKLDFELYVVTGSKQSRGRGFLEVVAAALEGGAGCIQYRDKDAPVQMMLPVARELHALCRQHGATFIINDRLDIALSVEADGVHLGQDDYPLPEARGIVGEGMILGASTHSLDEARRAEAEGADYINVGPVFATQTKNNVCAPVGVELVTRIKQAVSVPQTCMGGISAANVAEVVAAGAERCAVVSAVVGAEDVAAATRELLENIHEAKARRR